jgi:hypothetical protein
MPEIPRSENGEIWAPGTWTWISNYVLTPLEMGYLNSTLNLLQDTYGYPERSKARV